MHQLVPSASTTLRYASGSASMLYSASNSLIAPKILGSYISSISWYETATANFIASSDNSRGSKGQIWRRLIDKSPNGKLSTTSTVLWTSSHSRKLMPYVLYRQSPSNVCFDKKLSPTTAS